MLYWLIPLILLIITLITSYICYRLVFFSKKRVPLKDDEFEMPRGKAYLPYHEQLLEWMKLYRHSPHKDITVTSYDGLKLTAKFFEYSPDAPIEILFHGYRGTAERDLSGGIERCARLKHSVLIVDQRASSSSDGHIITFGAKESRDCIVWIDYVINNIDKDAKIILGGISMGASTVLIAAGRPLPENVVGILADCGFTSTKAIIKKVMRDIKIPPALLYPFVYLGAIIFGRFIPDELSPLEAVKRATLPIIFYHGDTDRFVPAYMSEEMFNACASEKKQLVIIKGAEHGLAFPVDMDKYVLKAKEFFDPLT